MYLVIQTAEKEKQEKFLDENSNWLDVYVSFKKHETS